MVPQATARPQPQPLAWLFLLATGSLFAGALVRWFKTQPNAPSLRAHSTPAPIQDANAALVLATRQGTRYHLSLMPGVPLTIGRCEQCQVRLDDAQVSQRHAQISFDGQGLHLTDCASTNGTWLNGRRISLATLRQGDAVHVGQTTLTLEHTEVMVRL